MSAEAGLGPQFWHITGRKNFRPSSSVRPMARGGRAPMSGPGLHVTTDPHHWVAVAGGSDGTPWAARRKWAVQVEPTEEHPAIQPEGFAAETMLDPSKVRVKRVIPVEHAVAETTGYLNGSWVGRAYRYPGPDFPAKRGTA